MNLQIDKCQADEMFKDAAQKELQQKHNEEIKCIAVRLKPKSEINEKY